MVMRAPPVLAAVLLTMVAGRPASAQAPEGGATLRDCRTCPPLVAVPGGRFVMGTPADEPGRADNEPPARPVVVAAFALGRTAVTRAEYAVFVRATGWNTDRGTRPGEHGCALGISVRGLRGDAAQRTWRAPGFVQDGRHPVVCVNAADAMAYVAWLSRTTGRRYRLPTEIEWEYAARAGSTGPQYWSGGPTNACGYANVADAAFVRRLNPRTPPDMHVACDDGFAFTAPVARFAPNAFGLYDMLGNVAQMTADCPTEPRAGALAARPGALAARPGEPPVTPCRWAPGGYGNGPFTRGAAWSDGPHRLRAGARGQLVAGVDRDATVGLRVARDL